MNKGKLWYLQQLNLFKDLPKDQLKGVEKCFTMKHYGKGQTIMEPDDNQKVFVVKKGLVELNYITKEGKKVILETLQPGSLFGHWDSEHENENYAEAVADSYVCSLDKESFFELVTEYPKIASRILQLLLVRLNVAHRRISSLASDSAFQKLARLFLQLGKEHGEYKNEKIIITDKFTHEQLSQMLGISRQTVTSLVNCMEKQNLIKREGKSYEFEVSALEAVG